jgi:Flp pilus assembly protein protease CpaA
MADGENVLSWTVSNWISVLLMVSVGFFLLGLGMKLYKSQSAA